MVDEATQQKLDKLAMIEQGNRDRSKKYMEKMKAAGKKQISCILSGKAFDELNRRRDASIFAGTPLSFGGIIEGALFQEPIEKKPVNKVVTIDVPTNDIKTSNVSELDDILLNMGMAEGKNWAAKAKELNEKGILTASGRPWTESNIRGFVKRLTNK